MFGGISVRRAKSVSPCVTSRSTVTVRCPPWLHCFSLHLPVLWSPNSLSLLVDTRAWSRPIACSRNESSLDSLRTPHLSEECDPTNSCICSQPGSKIPDSLKLCFKDFGKGSSCPVDPKYRKEKPWANHICSWNWVRKRNLIVSLAHWLQFLFVLSIHAEKATLSSAVSADCTDAAGDARPSRPKVEACDDSDVQSIHIYKKYIIYIYILYSTIVSSFIICISSMCNPYLSYH